MIHRRSKASQQPNLPGLFSSLNKSRRLSTPHEQALDVAHNRLIAATLVFAIAYLVIGGRLTFLSLANENPDVEIAEDTVHESAVGRADITDRNGTVLATSLPTISLCADTRKILSTHEAAQQLLSALPDLDVGKLHDDLNSAKRCAMIKRHLTPKQYYEVNKRGIAGLEFRPDERRMYPAGSTAAHVVGYTDIDNNGLAGVEQKFNATLEKESDPIELALDLRVQTIMQRELSQAMQNYNAIAAAGLVMDINSGEILSLVSLPDFDPQHPGKASDVELFNRDTLGVYEMGSTFKIFNTAMALDSGMIRMADSFDATQAIEIGGQKIRDFEKEDRWMNVAEIFTRSSNIGSARMAQRIGSVKQRAFFERLGLMNKTVMELPEVGAPLVPKERDWGQTMTMTASFGHGIAINTVQLASAVAAIMNGGNAIKPTLLHKPAGTPRGPSVVSEKTSAQMRALMRLVVARGTGKGARAEGYLLGGKTGTADKIMANKKYSADAKLSSFIGVFPMNAPKYLVFAMLDEPKGNAKTNGYATGGWVAAPVVGKVVSQIGPLLDIIPLTADMEAAAERQLLKPISQQILDGIPVKEGSNYASVETDRVQ